MVLQFETAKHSGGRLPIDTSTVLGRVLLVVALVVVVALIFLVVAVLETVIGALFCWIFVPKRLALICGAAVMCCVAAYIGQVAELAYIGAGMIVFLVVLFFLAEIVV